jgi:hypothetical protein
MRAEKAMDILEKHYPNEDHVVVFHNAKTHLKRADDAFSACHMQKTLGKHLPPALRRVLVFGLTKKALMGSWFMSPMEKC